MSEANPIPSPSDAASRASGDQYTERVFIPEMGWRFMKPLTKEEEAYVAELGITRQTYYESFAGPGWQLREDREG